MAHSRGCRRMGFPKERKSPTSRFSRLISAFMLARTFSKSSLRGDSSGPRRVRTWSIERLMKFSGFLISCAMAEARRPMAVDLSAKCSRSSSRRFSRSRSTISLNVRERLPISSLPPLCGTWTDRSPAATCLAASVSPCSGRLKVHDR